MKSGWSSGSLKLAGAVAMAAAAVAFNAFSLGRMTIFLNVGLVLSLFCWLAAGNETRTIHPRLGPLFILSIPVQAIHFLEE